MLFFQDAGLYVCGARNTVNKDGDKQNGVVYLNMAKGRKREKKFLFEEFVCKM